MNKIKWREIGCWRRGCNFRKDGQRRPHYFILLLSQIIVNAVAENSTFILLQFWSLGSLKSVLLGQNEGHTPFRGSREGSFLSFTSFWWFQASYGWWPHSWSLCLWLHVAFCSVSVSSPHLSFIRTLVIGFRTHLKIVNVIISAGTLSLNKVTFIGPGIKTWMDLLGGPHSAQ